MIKSLPKSFYTREDVVEIAKDLLGKILFTDIEGYLSGGIITETEAYAGIIDKASHAYGGRRTRRTETMYAEGGTSYVYFTYGMHYLFNVVTNKKDIPHAVLIRAVYPVTGFDIMLKRTGKQKVDYKLTNGPAKLTKSLGITKKQNGISLVKSGVVWIEDRNIVVKPQNIITSPRIGIAYAQEDALLPYRFELKNIDFKNSNMEA
jgi:DNA-3-methyladenine glycosylase